MAKVTGPNQFSLAVGYRTTAKVDDRSILELLKYNTKCIQLKIPVFHITVIKFVEGNSSVIFTTQNSELY